MPRSLRLKSISNIYHVMIRGVNKVDIFLDIEDRKKILQIIKYYKNTYEVKVIAYCLMDNHVHLLIESKLTDNEIKEFLEDYLKMKVDNIKNLNITDRNEILLKKRKGNRYV